MAQYDVLHMVEKVVCLGPAFVGGHGLSLSTTTRLHPTALQKRLNGLNSIVMSVYVEHVADQPSEQLCVARYYRTLNPVGGLCSMTLHLPLTWSFAVPCYGRASCPRMIEVF